MEITMTTDLQPATKSQVAAVQRHVEHDPNEDHKNDQIVSSDTELNTFHRLYDDDDVLQQHYGKWIDERNAKNEADFKNGKITAVRYEERKQTVQEFIAGSNGSKPKKAMTNIVVTPGSLETLPDIYNLLGVHWEMQKVGKGKEKHDRPTVIGDADREKVKQFYDSFGMELAKSLNSSQDGMVITTVATNLDEGGAPHIHMGAVNMGVSDKTGKPVASLDAAIQTTLPDSLRQWTTRHNKKTGNDDKIPSAKGNMREWRDIFDNGATDVLTETLQRYGVSEKLDMVRLGDTGSVTMAQYKAQKALDAQREQQQRRQVALDQQENELAAEKNELQKQEIAQQKKQKLITMREREQAGIEKREVELKQFKADMETKNSITQVQSQLLDAREKQITSREDYLQKQRVQQQKQQNLIKMREREQAETMVDVIAHYEPTHKVRELGQEAQEVQTPDGREQHLKQPFKKIARMMISVISNAMGNVKNMAQAAIDGVDLAYVKQAASRSKYTTTPKLKPKNDGLDL